MSLKESIRHRFFALPIWQRLALLLAASVLLVLVVVGTLASGRAALSRWRFSRDAAHLTAEINDWKAKAQAAESRAVLLDGERLRLQKDLDAATAKAEAALAALDAAGRQTQLTRKIYDEIRNRPLSAVPVTDADGLCAKLAAIAFPCSVPVVRR